MVFSWLRLLIPFSRWQQIFSILLLTFVTGFSGLFLVGIPPALASLNDDRFDGNIFVLYAGNSSLVPPRFTLAESLKQSKPTLLVFYVDDSSDCKLYSAVVSGLQGFYGRDANFIAISVDTIPQKSSYASQEPGYYYHGLIPQTVLLDQSGQVVLNAKGKVPFEQVDDRFREVFDLLPRSESVELMRRPINEINPELIQP